MSTMNRLSIGIVGACGPGADLKPAATRRRFAARSFSQELDQSYRGFNSRSWFSLWGPPFSCVMGAWGG